MASNDEYQQQSFIPKLNFKPDGYEIHMKYKELGGYGIFIGNETQYMINKEIEVKLKLKEWINNYGKI